MNVTPDSVWWHGIGYVRVMAVAEGYAMARRPRCMPFVIACKRLIAEHVERPDAQRDAAPAVLAPANVPERCAQMLDGFDDRFICIRSRGHSGHHEASDGSEWSNADD